LVGWLVGWSVGRSVTLLFYGKTPRQIEWLLGTIQELTSAHAAMC